MLIKDIKTEVTIIVPVFNVEPYLDQCLNSIIQQTFKNIEIIIINDGSTDNSLNIAQKYALKDCRVKIINQTNIGLGPTRNKGIDLATSPYIFFIDSDDYVPDTMIEKMMEEAYTSDSDIVVGEVMVVDEKGDNGYIRQNYNKKQTIILNNEERSDFYRDFYYTRKYSHNAWDKLYKKSFLIKNAIRFGDNKKIFAEDNWFQLQCLLHEPKITFNPYVCYYYRQQKNSIMHNPKKELVYRHANMVSDYNDLIKRNGSHKCDIQNCNLVAADILVLESINQKIKSGKFKCFKKNMFLINEVSILREQIIQISTNKSYRLIKSDSKRSFVMIVSCLFKFKLYNLVYLFCWIYYIKYGEKK